MFSFYPEDEDDDKYWLWRFMIDKAEQGKGYDRAALAEIIQYFDVPLRRICFDITVSCFVLTR